MIRVCLAVAFLTSSIQGTFAFAQPSDSSSAAWVEEGKQVFLARTQLEAYREELIQDGVGKRLGVDKLLGADAGDNGFLTLFGQSVRLVAFNTLNYGRLLFTHEEESLLVEWGRQRDALDKVIAGLQITYGLMETREVRLDEAVHIVETEQQFHGVRSWVEALAQSPWGRQILAGSQIAKRPVTPSDFGLDFKTDFVDENWAVFLSEQVNIANVYVFWRGPQMIAALGETKLGLAIAQTLRLNKLIAAVKALPTVIQKPALWMIYETADGCTIRYFYTAYLGLHQIGHRQTSRVTGKVESP